MILDSEWLQQDPLWEIGMYQFLVGAVCCNMVLLVFGMEEGSVLVSPSLVT